MKQSIPFKQNLSRKTKFEFYYKCYTCICIWSHIGAYVCLHEYIYTDIERREIPTHIAIFPFSIYFKRKKS